MSMVTYANPGVYIEDLYTSADPDSLGRIRRRPVPPAGRTSASGRPGPRARWIGEHSVAAFVGLAVDGPVHRAVPISDTDQFEYTFGGSVVGGYLADAVWGYFANGGRSCCVVRVNDGNELRATADDFLGDAADRTGLEGLAPERDLSTVCAPDVMALYDAGVFGVDTVRAVQLGMTTHCELHRDRMAVLDPPAGLDLGQILEWRRDVTRYESDFGALYYPWIKVLDRGSGVFRAVPPSGHIAGVYARTDLQFGPHHSSIGEPIAGTIGPVRDVLVGEQELLHPSGINSLVGRPGAGTVIWGNRSLSVTPRWRHVQTRRLMNFIDRNIVQGMAWVISEPGDRRSLFAPVERELSGLLERLWRAGALHGDTPAEAFSVRCDEETSPAEQLDAGQVIAMCRAVTIDGTLMLFRVVHYLG